MIKDVSAEKFFIEHTNYVQTDILDCKLFHDGYTFKSYLVSLKDKASFQIKISKSQQPTIINEGIIYDAYNKHHIIYYDTAGNIIKKWIECTEPPSHTDPEILKLVFAEIAKFHQLSMTLSPYRFEFAKYNKYLSEYNKQLCMQFEVVLERHKNDKVVLSHGDVNHLNYLVYKQHQQFKVLLIDFEWCCQNYVWFDYINIPCEDEIYNEKVLQIFAAELGCDVQQIWIYMFMRWCFTLGWAIAEKNNLPRMEEYILKCEKNLKVIKQHLVLL